jgi:hypothetical protein
MNDFQKAWSQTLKLLRDDGRTVLFGTALGAVFAAITPYSIQFGHRGYTWARQHWLGVHPRKDALAIAVFALVITGLFSWPSPWILKWIKSLWQGVNHGLFLLPMLATFTVLTEGLQGARAEFAEITGALLAILVFAAWRSLAAQAAHPAINPSENPLKFTSDDRLERTEFAKTVTEDILGQGKPTYAIYGEFGSGKSTMLNFIEEKLTCPRRQAIVVRFNGWLPGSTDDLATQLWNDIAAACKKEYSIPGLRRAALRLANTVAASAPYMQGLKAWLPENTQQETIAEASHLLTRLPMQVVVLVDEIDRMKKDELLVLLKAIRGFTSLPNLTFVCALERRTVERLVCSEYGSDSHVFFQKFFIRQFWLPKVNDYFLETETANRLATVLGDLGWFEGDEESKAEYQNAIRSHWRKAFAPLCTNLRAIQLFQSALRSAASPIVGEVDPLDLTLVMLLQQFLPDAHDLIWEYRNVFAPSESTHGSMDDKDELEISVSAYFEKEKGLYPESSLHSSISEVRDILSPKLELFHSAKSADNGRLRARIDLFSSADKGAEERKLRSPSYISAYFQSEVPGGIYPEQAMKQLLTKIRLARTPSTSTESLEEELNALGSSKEIASAERRSNFLSKLADQTAGSVDPEQAKLVARATAAFVGNIEVSWTDTDLNNAARLVVSVADVLPAIEESNPRVEFLQDCMRIAIHDGVCFKVFLNAVRQESYNDEAANQMRKNLTPVFLQRMEARYGPNSAVDQVDLRLSSPSAFRQWGILLNMSEWAPTSDVQNIQKVFWERYITSSARLAEFSRQVLAGYDPDFIGPAEYSFAGARIISVDDLRRLMSQFPIGDAKDSDLQALHFAQQFVPSERQTSSSEDIAGTNVAPA